jgi:Tfp pilus assembly protein FimV
VHGGDLCAECLDPSSALPSFNLYRGSLLVLLIGTAIAIWLLVRPPGTGDGPGVVLTDFTPTVIVTQVIETETPSGGGTPGLGTPTPAATASDGTNSTETPEENTYVVQEGDTLFGIAEEFAPPGVSPFEYAEAIAEANDLGDVDSAIITPGDTLVLP